MAKSLKDRLRINLESFGDDGVPLNLLAKKKKQKLKKKIEETPVEEPNYEELVQEFNAFLTQVEGSPLRAWRVHLDPDGDGRLNEFQFVHAVREMNFRGDPKAVFRGLDADNSGELSLEEIDSEQSLLWSLWCDWCAQTFSSSSHMIQAINDRGGTVLTEKDFLDGLERLEWPHGHEDVLFRVMDIHNRFQLTAADLKWFDLEKKKQRKKATAKDRAKRDRKKQIYAPRMVKSCLDRFKKHLKISYGSYIRAWRKALSPNDAVSCSRNQFLTSCTQLGFKDMSKVLWRAFGKDESSAITFDFLDSASAEMLAKFQALVRRLGGVRGAFRSLDKKDLKRIKQPEFIQAMKQLEPDIPTTTAKMLFNGLDKDGSNRIEEDDLYFIDSWKLPEFLNAEASPEAAEAFKEVLYETSGNYLKGWRQILDTDNSNRCSWLEFQQACRKLGFTSDVAGAWRALDEDLSGSISLEEIDSASSQILTNFREWADSEFGGVKSAFTVFDDDGSNSLSLKEWRHACRLYGYIGDAKTLFSALDCDQTGFLSLEEMAFMDDWDFPRERGPSEQPEEDADADAEDTSAKKRAGSKRSTSNVPLMSQTTIAIPGLKKPPPKRAPRIGLAERSWWHELPCKQPFPKANGPGTGLPVAWCSLCKSRGPCRHFAPTEALPSVTTDGFHARDQSTFQHMRNMGSIKDEMRITGTVSLRVPLSARSPGLSPQSTIQAPLSARVPRSYEDGSTQLPKLGARAAAAAYPYGMREKRHADKMSFYGV